MANPLKIIQVETCKMTVTETLKKMKKSLRSDPSKWKNLSAKLKEKSPQRSSTAASTMAMIKQNFTN